MKELLFANVGMISLVFTLGYGLAAYLTPRKIKSLSLWLAPWFAIVAISISTVIASLSGVPVKYSGPVITIALLGLSAISMIRGRKYQIKPLRDGILIAVVLASILVNQTLLIKGQKMLTTVSLGNNDVLVYAAVPDYLVDNTILEILILDRQEGVFDYKGVANLLQNGYRWGTPATTAYFLNMLGFQGYQLAYIFQVILFGLTIPLGYILFVLIHGKEDLKGLILTVGLLSLNAHLLYMLYHNFAGQIMFWGLELFFVIYLMLYVDKIDKPSLKFNFLDYVLGATLASLYFSYHEGVVFLIGPMVVFFLISLIQKKKIAAYWQSFTKIGLITLVFSSMSVVQAIVFDVKQSKLIESPIGWQLFREKVPFANPFEMFGFYSIHSFEPLSVWIAIALSVMILIVLYHGVKSSKKSKLLGSFVFVYLIFIWWTTILHNNFFLYNRIITYILPVLTPILVSGIILVTSKKVKLQIFVIVVGLGMTAYSGALLNLRFFKQNVAVDRALISLKELANAEIDEIIYTDDVYRTDGFYWRQIWKYYFLHPKKEIVTPLNIREYNNNVPSDALILVPRNPWYNQSKLIFKEIVWDNGFFSLGKVCVSDECLLEIEEDLSKIVFGQTLHDDVLLADGWDELEINHRWVNQKRAELKLVSKNTKPEKIVIMAHSLGEPQIMTVIIDGKIAGRVNLAFTSREYEIPITGLNNHIYNIAFEFSNFYSPAQIYAVQDERSLYANFSQILLK